MLKVNAQLTQGVAAGAGREAGFLTAAWPYVPGWVLRGALAATWIRENGKPSESPHLEEFIDVFEGDIRFGPLMPDGVSIEPLSVLRCKYRPKAECERSVIDLADADPTQQACPVCLGPVEQGKGRFLAARTQQHTRVELDSDGRAKDGKLFTREEIAPGTTLSGCIAGEHPWLSRQSNTVTWLGGRRSTGGRARIDIGAGNDATAGVPNDADRLVVRCASPMICLDHHGRPMLQPDATELADRLGVATTSIHLDRQFARPLTIGGWHAASGLPKPKDITVIAGSTFVYTVDGLDVAACQRLAQHGLGERTREGFGWIEVNPAPWKPPVQLESAAAATGPSSQPLANVIKLARPERVWIAGLLSERALGAEGGRTLDETPAADPRASVRFRSLGSDTQAELEELFNSMDPIALRRVSNHLKVLP